MEIHRIEKNATLAVEYEIMEECKARKMYKLT